MFGFSLNILPPKGRRQPWRIALIVLLLAGAGWWYAGYFERRMAEFSSGRDIVAPQGVLTRDQRSALQELSRDLKKHYGFLVRLHVRDRQGPLPELTPQTLFASIGPGEDAIVVLPHLAGRALPPETTELYAERLAICSRVAPPGSCLERFLLALRDDLQQ